MQVLNEFPYAASISPLHFDCILWLPIYIKIILILVELINCFWGWVSYSLGIWPRSYYAAKADLEPLIFPPFLLPKSWVCLYVLPHSAVGVLKIHYWKQIFVYAHAICTHSWMWMWKYVEVRGQAWVLDLVSLRRGLLFSPHCVC